MGSLQGILKNDSRINRQKPEYVTQMVHYTKLKPSKKQFYNFGSDMAAGLADNIELAKGVKEPLLVRRIDADSYEILCGHKRFAAVKLLVETRNLPEYAFIPIHCILCDEWEAEYILISTNDYPYKSEYERMMEVIRMEIILPHLKGDESIKGRTLRRMIAEETGLYETKIANYKSIYKGLGKKAMLLFKEDELRISVAIKLAALPEEKQDEFIENNDKYSIAAVDHYIQCLKDEEYGNIEKPLNEEDRGLLYKKQRLKMAKKLFNSIIKRKQKVEGNKKLQLDIQSEALQLWLEQNGL